MAVTVTLGQFGDIQPMLMELLHRKQFTDLEFSCDDGVLPCHRFIVGARSSFLKRVLSEERRSDPDFPATIRLPGVQTRDVSHALQFLYTGTLVVSASDIPAAEQVLENVFRLDVKLGSLPAVYVDKEETLGDVGENDPGKKEQAQSPQQDAGRREEIGSRLLDGHSSYDIREVWPEVDITDSDEEEEDDNDHDIFCLFEEDSDPANPQSRLSTVEDLGDEEEDEFECKFCHKMLADDRLLRKHTLEHFRRPNPNASFSSTRHRFRAPGTTSDITTAEFVSVEDWKETSATRGVEVADNLSDDAAEMQGLLPLLIDLPPPIPFPPEPGMVVYRGQWVTPAQQAALKARQQLATKRQAASATNLVVKVRKYRYKPGLFTISGQSRMSTLEALLEDDGEFMCPYEGCGLVYARQRSLNVHIRRSHMRDSFKVTCPECGKKLSTTNAMSQHLLSHRPRESWPYFCPLCERKFQSKGSLPKHFWKHLNNGGRLPLVGSPGWRSLCNAGVCAPQMRSAGGRRRRRSTKGPAGTAAANGEEEEKQEQRVEVGKDVGTAEVTLIELD